MTTRILALSCVVAMSLGLATAATAAQPQITDRTRDLVSFGPDPAVSSACGFEVEVLNEGRVRILEYSDAQTVSVDYNGNPHSAIFDSTNTFVIDNMAKVMAWYDNEWGFSNRMVDVAKFLVSKGL